MVSLIKITHQKILKSPALWISLVFIIFFLAFSPKAIGGSFANSPSPDANFIANIVSIKIASAIVITGLLITVMTSFGESFVKIKSSLIYQNTKLNNKPQYQFYFATILPVVVYSTIVFVVSMGSLAMFDAFGLLGTDKNIIQWKDIQYHYLLISLITTVGLGVSLSLLFSTVSKTDGTYTALVWGYLFLVFFFGGSSVPIFLIRGDDSLAAFMYLSMSIPSTFSNFLFVNAMVGEVEFVKGDIDITYILDIVIPVIIIAIVIGTNKLLIILKK